MRETQIQALLDCHAVYETACVAHDTKAMKNALAVFSHTYKKSSNAEQGEYHHRFVKIRSRKP